MLVGENGRMGAVHGEATGYELLVRLDLQLAA